MGLISGSPNAKETILADIEEQPFRSEECCESLEHKSSPLRLNKATKIRSASNHFKILHLNTKSIKKDHEELEALISCFESPPSII